MAKRGRKPKIHNTNAKKSTNKTSVPGATNAVENMKYEIANEFGVNLGASASSTDNGRVGGEMTKRLVEMAKTSKKKSSNK